MGQTAVLLIGVSRVDGFDELKAVGSAIRRMRHWAETQTDRIVELTDLDGSSVTISQIIDAIEQLLGDSLMTKLVIYFSGHGFYASLNEYWLLSDAPRRSHEAVNLAGSIALAEALETEHVVLISDACRTPATTLETSQITGSSMFPIRPVVRQTSAIDVYYGCAPGKPSIEVSGPGGSGYVAVFTDAIASVLEGEIPDFLDDEGENGRYVRTHRLKDCLPQRVSDVLRKLNVPLIQDQLPWSVVRSNPVEWVSHLQPPSGGGPEIAEQLPPTTPRVFSVEGQVAAKVRIAIADAKVVRRTDSFVGDSASRALVPATDEIILRVDGIPLERVYVWGEETVTVFEADAGGHLVLTEPRSRGLTAGSPLTLQFADGGCLPLLIDGGTFAHILAEEGSVRSVSYTRAGNLRPWSPRADTILRTAIEEAISTGMFAPDSEVLDELVALMRGRKDVDPSLALYTAYVLHGRHRYDDLREMRQIMEMTTGWDFFDLSMLQQFGQRDSDLLPPRRVAPGFPVLSQGWPLLFALEEPSEYQLALQEHRRDGLWTSFAAGAWPLLVEGPPR